MLVNMDRMLKKAVKDKYAIGHFNINNLEWAKAILEVAQENNSPVILGVSEGAAKYMGGYRTIIGMVNGLLSDLSVSVPVALHLDHGSYEGVVNAVEAGFSSVMFDGSHYPIDVNIEKTKELLKITVEQGISLEVEVGAIGGEEDGISGNGEIASPQECRMLVDIGVSAIAAGIGNIHGKYPENWKGLDLDTLAEIKKIVQNVPLVLHGGTGIPEEMVKKAIGLGIAKVNVNTECQLAFSNATREYIIQGKDLTGKGFDPRKLLAPGYEAIKEVVKEKMILFDSIGKGI